MLAFIWRVWFKGFLGVMLAFIWRVWFKGFLLGSSTVAYEGCAARRT
jgi:hypothetical protein